MSGIAIANQIGASIDGRAAASNFALDADLLDLVQESLVVFDLDGRIKRWNKASERIYAWSRAQAEGRLFAEISVSIDGLTQNRCCGWGRANPPGWSSVGGRLLARTL